MIHDLPEIEKILEKWSTHANEKHDMYLSNPEKREYYLGMIVALKLVKEDIAAYCRQEEANLYASYRKLSDIIEAPDGFYRVKTVMNGPSGLPGER